MATEFRDGPSPETAEKLWTEAKAALNAGNHERSIELFKVLAEDGDWRASTSLGYIYEARGKADSSAYIIAAHWYSRALSQEEQPEAHLALGRYYYFGLGGERDFRRAFEHLRQVPLDKDPQVALMLGELYLLGLGVPKDLGKARQMFTSLAQSGVPVGFRNLFRLEKLEGHRFRSWLAFFRGLLAGVKMAVKDRDDPRLVGLRRNGGNFRLDGIRSADISK